MNFEQVVASVSRLEKCWHLQEHGREYRKERGEKNLFIPNCYYPTKYKQARDLSFTIVTQARDLAYKARGAPPERQNF